ncbi:sensor domain-containing diguanylate cyclase/phosphohydrolase [Clostridium saccharobutylicum]|uniref:Cyclic di-GMP phosphodiesterase response regulator RpfG n=1 Tax=Clostridium saccharobutylicum TaxID=169679 RepID=A0A1S8NIX0_CLOSA|nr:HD domain-containing phosphohydrolase [Clostridium saccharobutylicum]OOM16191.1 cyclic di-GMP phosphodiesterase response regulator RpfG [Clostridium saccharobutylicum]
MQQVDMLKTYKLFLNNLPWPVWIEGIDSKILYLNKHYEDKFKIKLEEAIGKYSEEVFLPEKVNIYNKNVKECLQSSNVCVLEGTVNGSFIECYIFPIKDDNGHNKAVAGIVMDINDRKEREIYIENQKNILRTIIDAVPESIFYKDTESRFIGYNKKFKEFYNKKGVTDIIGKSDIQIYDDKETAAKFIELDKKIISTKKAKYYEDKVKDENGEERIEENVKIPVINDDGEVWGVVGLSRDITERKNMEEKLRYLSQTDILTGTYNRYSFEEKVKELNYEKYLPLGIIMGDVNGLKLVNDTLGHLEGDKLLKNISNILKQICDLKGYVFRWGGDEFIILLPNSDQSKCEAVIRDIRRKCEEAESDFIQLSIALGESVKYDLKDDIYNCIKKVEEKVYRQKLLDKKSIKSSIMESLRKSLEEKNMETNEHTERVQKYALALGEKMKLKISDLDELILVASLHDIGKIGINEEILLKPGKLTDEEFEIMKTHTEIGYRIINASSELGNVAKSVLTHHEKWDGSGYPLGLKGEEIPLLARIINVVDSYDIMTRDKIYRKAIDKKKAISELKKHAGKQFDPEIVRHLIDYIEDNEV